MIDFIDEKYGKVRIYESKDLPLTMDCVCMEKFDLIGFQNFKEGTGRLFQNRGSLGDGLAIQFIANYGREKLVPIESRWEILDL